MPRLPAAPRKRTYGLRDASRPVQSSLERVRRLSRDLDERDRPFSPERAPTWKGSSRDLVVNRRHRPNAHQTGFGFGEALELRMPSFGWRQIGGDMDPGAHGGLIATADGDQIELIEIQPVREYVGDGEAAEVGFPFWTKEATYDLSELSLNSGDVQGALQFVSLDHDQLQELDPEQRVVAIAEALMRYGVGSDEGPRGWAEDLLQFPIEWWGGTIATFPEYCGDEDDEFRREVLEEEWHYVYGGGLRGYLYQDGPHYAETHQEAVEALVESYEDELSPEEVQRMRAALTKDSYYEFDDIKAAGNEYVEIERAEGPIPDDED